MKAIVAAGLALCLAVLPAQAQQGWGNLDTLLFRHLTSSGTAEASFWLPDNVDPAQASRALGVVYEHVPGSAGTTSIAVGLFVKQANGWIFAGTVRDLFGHSPRDIAFGAGFAEVTTTMLGPDDPRCCPTVPVRWRVDLTTLQALRLH